MAAANAGSFRLVRCPKCLNVLPEPPNVTVYKCGGCDTTLRAKIRVNNGQSAPTKQARQDSDDYSVATTVSNGVLPQTKNLTFGGAATDSSCTAADAPSTETEHESNGASTNDNDHVLPSEEDAFVVANTESNEDCNNSSDGQNTSARMEGPSDLTHPSANGTDTDTDSDREETDDVYQESPENPEACREGEDGDTECNQLNASDSEHDVPLSERSKSDSELNAAVKTEADAAAAAASKKSNLVRMQSRSCDLREAHGASLTSSLDYTSFQSKSFRASEPLQSKIMKTVDELRGDLSEFFRKPAASSECKPKAAAYHPPPRPSKQGGGYVAPRAAVTSSAPLAAYHAAVKRSGHAAAAARLSRSGQVPPPRGLPSPRYRRRRGCSYCHSGQMEMARQQCTHDECYHSCRPPPFHRQWNQEAALLQQQRPPPAKEMKRRAVPRNHCRPVLRGAPFVVCSRCLRLVELPTGFAVPSRGTRRLQCGSCSAVLSYSYRDPGKKRLQSPSGDEEYSTDDYDIHHVAAAAGTGDYRAGCHDADPFSYSEEYGVMSYSTEDEQPLHVSRNSSFGTVEGRDGKDSKLHRLMGYSSASEILWHSPGLYESFEKRTTPVGARTPQDRKGKGVAVADDDGCSGGQGGATKGSNARSGGLLLQGFLKRGIHGLESLKLRS